MKIPNDEDWQKLKEAPLTPVVISCVDMLCLLGSIQLALRHPGNRGPSSKVARIFGEEIEKRIVEASPNFREMCAAGWDESHDVPCR